MQRLAYVMGVASGAANVCATGEWSKMLNTETPYLFVIYAGDE